ncbi:MAG: glycosyltransferase family 39 protein [Bacteroidota bacterium]
MNRSRIPTEIIIILLAAMAYIPFLGSAHLFDWDEINFAESAREMVVSGDYTFVQINFQPFWEKPPLFIWMQAASMKLFGVNEFAARFPNALCGILTLLVLYWIGKREKDEKLGWLWALAYGCSILPFLYFKSGIIDPWFNLFMMLGIYFGYRYLTDSQQKGLSILLAGVFTGGAMLTKGPVGPLIVGLVGLSFLILNRDRLFQVRFVDILLLFVGFVAIGGFWFILQIFQGRWDVVVDFIEYQIRLFQTKDAGHGGFPGYHVVVLFIGVFPASIFALGELLRRDKSGKKALVQIMKITFWVVIVLFSIVRTKIVHYSSMCYFPIAFLAAWNIHSMWAKENSIKVWQKGALIFVGGIFITLVGVLFFAEDIQQSLQAADWIQDPFAKGNLEANGNWKGMEGVPALFLLGGLTMSLIGWRKNIQPATWVLFFGTALFTLLTVVWVVPRIEEYSQHSAIEFWKSHAEEDAYAMSVFYKSYAPCFYAKVPAQQDARAHDVYWLMTGELDKPAYFATKIHKKEKLENLYPQLEFLYSSNGFAFYKRSPN